MTAPKAVPVERLPGYRLKPDNDEPAKPEAKDYHENDHLQAYRIRRGFSRIATFIRLSLAIPVLGILVWYTVREGYGAPPTDEIARKVIDLALMLMAAWGLTALLLPPLAWVFAGFARDESIYKERKAQYGKALEAWADGSAI
jgi:hypothetical protein